MDIEKQFKRIRRDKKPKECPQCGSGPIIDIVYGYIDLDTDPSNKRAFDNGEFILGGCCISFDDPLWQCKNCDLRIYDANPGDPYDFADILK